MDACAYSMTVTGVLRRVYGRMRHGTEVLSRAVGVNPRTAKNWMDGTNAPRGAELIRLMQECDELREEINRIVEEGKCRKVSELTLENADLDGAESHQQSASGSLPSMCLSTE